MPKLYRAATIVVAEHPRYLSAEQPNNLQPDKSFVGRLKGPRDRSSSFASTFFLYFSNPPTEQKMELFFSRATHCSLELLDVCFLYDAGLPLLPSPSITHTQSNALYIASTHALISKQTNKTCSAVILAAVAASSALIVL